MTNNGSVLLRAALAGLVGVAVVLGIATIDEVAGRPTAASPAAAPRQAPEVRIYLPCLLRPRSTTLPPVELSLRYQLDGVAFDLVQSGDVMFAGLGPHLAAFRLVGNRITLLGRSALLPDDLYGLAGRGTLVYAAASKGGLVVLDVTRPAEPVVLAQLALPGSATDVELLGDLAAVTTDGGGLQLVNVADPRQPKRVGSLADPIHARAVAVASAGYLYVVEGIWDSNKASLDGALWVVDVADPARPTLVDRLDEPGFGLRVDGARLFVFQGSVTKMFDLGDPAHPRPAASIPIPGHWLGRDGIAYASNASDLLTFDITDIEHPVPLGSLRGVSAGTAANMVLTGPNLWYAVPDEFALARPGAGNASGHSLGLADVTDPAVPRHVANTIPVALHAGCIHTDSQAICTGADYRAAGNQLRFVDVTEPARSQTIGRRQLLDTEGEIVTIDDHRGFTVALVKAAGGHSLRLLRPSGADALETVGSTAVEARSPSDFAQLRIDGTTAYVLALGIVAVDLSDPAAPRSLGAVGTWYAESGIAIANGLAVIPQWNRVVIADVSPPESARELASVPLAFDPYQVEMAGSYAFVLGKIQDGSNVPPRQLAVLDLSRPEAPVQVATIDRDLPGSILLSGHHLYSRGHGLTVFDIADPTAPRLIATFRVRAPGSQTYNRVNDVWRTERSLYISLQDGAMRGLTLAIQPPP